MGGLTTVYGIWAITQYDMAEQAAAGFGLTLFFLLIWWFTRKRIIAIHPHGGKPLEVSASLMKEHRADELVEKIQLAKTERLKQLYKI
jgi:hypothetical protein